METKETILDDRVAEHTDPRINNRIITAIRKSIAFYSDYPDKIDDRLAELKKEWDFERMLEANASILVLYGLIKGIIGRKPIFLLLPFVVAGFLLQHALQGWCPPILVLRRLGIRTKEEILLEHYSLRAIRGDFGQLAGLNELSVRDRIERVMAAFNA